MKTSRTIAGLSPIFLFIGVACMTMLPSVTIAQADSEAGRIWELAIKAKGGRTALYKIDSILIESTSQSRTISGRRYQRKETALAILPFKGWSYTDDRPEVFGETVSMINFENLTGYFGGRGNDNMVATPLSPLERGHKNYQNPTIFYLMESKWLKPKPLGVKDGFVGKEKVFLVETDYDGRRVDFALNADTYLPSKITTYEIGTDGVARPNELSLSNYVEVDGVKVPQTTRYNKQSPGTLTLRFNVEYDRSIFIRAPAQLGPDAWKLKQ